MRYVFLFGPVALTVYHFVLPTGEERGARLEIQRTHEVPPPNHSAAIETCIKEPLWRGDLFSHVGGPEGNWDRAHYHSHFDGMEPVPTRLAGGREWDPALI